MWSCSQGPSPCCWDCGIPKIHIIKRKAQRALRGTAVLNCSTAVPAHCRSQGMDGAGEVFPGWALPPTAAPENRHCHLLFTGCNRQAGAASEQGRGRTCSIARIPCLQSDPLEGSKKGLGGGNNSPAASSPERFSTGTTSSHSPGMSTNQTQTRLSYICMFIISKYSIYIRYSNTFENFIQKRVSTKLNQQTFCV